jgi:hypothetical protein
MTWGLGVDRVECLWRHEAEAEERRCHVSMPSKLIIIFTLTGLPEQGKWASKHEEKTISTYYLHLEH